MAVPNPHTSILGGGGRRLPVLRRVSLALVAASVMVVALAAPASASAMGSGVDVSSHQHPGGAAINWVSVKASGHSFGFIKATEGTHYTNPYFVADWTGAGAAGLFRGAYHFARPALPLSTAIDQARYFVSRTGAMKGARDLPAVLDLEASGGLGRTELATWTRTWLSEVKRLTGKAPMVYTGYNFWREKVGNRSDIGADYRLLLASYPSNPNSATFRPLVPTGWANWTFWQYTSTGSVPGIQGSTDLIRSCWLGQRSALPAKCP